MTILNSFEKLGSTSAIQIQMDEKDTKESI